MTGAEQSDSTGAAAPPLLRVVRGTPTEAELAAVVAVLLSTGSGAETGGEAPGDRPPRGGWTDRSLALRALPTHGPGAWRGSARAR